MKKILLLASLLTTTLATLHGARSSAYQETVAAFIALGLPEEEAREMTEQGLDPADYKGKEVCCEEESDNDSEEQDDESSDILELDLQDDVDLKYAITLMRTENTNRLGNLPSSLTPQEIAFLDSFAKKILASEKITDYQRTNKDERETIRAYLNLKLNMTSPEDREYVFELIDDINTNPTGPNAKYARFVRDYIYKLRKQDKDHSFSLTDKQKKLIAAFMDAYTLRSSKQTLSRWTKELLIKERARIATNLLNTDMKDIKPQDITCEQLAMLEQELQDLTDWSSLLDATYKGLDDQFKKMPEKERKSFPLLQQEIGTLRNYVGDRNTSGELAREIKLLTEFIGKVNACIRESGRKPAAAAPSLTRKPRAAKPKKPKCPIRTGVTFSSNATHQIQNPPCYQDILDQMQNLIDVAVGIINDPTQSNSLPSVKNLLIQAAMSYNHVYEILDPSIKLATEVMIQEIHNLIIFNQDNSLDKDASIRNIQELKILTADLVTVTQLVIAYIHSLSLGCSNRAEIDELFEALPPLSAFSRYYELSQQIEGIKDLRTPDGMRAYIDLNRQRQELVDQNPELQQELLRKSEQIDRERKIVFQQIEQQAPFLIRTFLKDIIKKLTPADLDYPREEHKKTLVDMMFALEGPTIQDYKNQLSAFHVDTRDLKFIRKVLLMYLNTDTPQDKIIDFEFIKGFILSRVVPEDYLVAFTEDVKSVQAEQKAK